MPVRKYLFLLERILNKIFVIRLDNEKLGCIWCVYDTLLQNMILYIDYIKNILLFYMTTEIKIYILIK